MSGKDRARKRRFTQRERKRERMKILPNQEMIERGGLGCLEREREIKEKERKTMVMRILSEKEMIEEKVRGLRGRKRNKREREEARNDENSVGERNDGGEVKNEREIRGKERRTGMMKILREKGRQNWEEIKRGIETERKRNDKPHSSLSLSKANALAHCFSF